MFSKKDIDAVIKVLTYYTEYEERPEKSIKYLVDKYTDNYNFSGVVYRGMAMKDLYDDYDGTPYTSLEGILNCSSLKSYTRDLEIAKSFANIGTTEEGIVLKKEVKKCFSLESLLEDMKLLVPDVYEKYIKEKEVFSSNIGAKICLGEFKTESDSNLTKLNLFG